MQYPEGTAGRINALPGAQFRTVCKPAEGCADFRVGIAGGSEPFQVALFNRCVLADLVDEVENNVNNPLIHYYGSRKNERNASWPYEHGPKLCSTNLDTSR